MTVKELFTYRILTISNLLSLSRILGIPAMWYILAHPHDISSIRLYTALTLFFMTLTDFLDGYLARRLGQETPLGQYLDPIADKIVIISGLGLLVYYRDFPLWVTIFVGLREIIGKSQLSFGESRTEPADARNEIQTADYFAARLKTLQEPFFSVYISFAPHYPYHDYGPEWRITPGRSRLDRYVDNLRLLDEQLKKFFSALQQRGSLNNTIVVLVGDHSEAFKQHPGNYIHSLHSYEENLAVPAMIWYPARLRPREINFPTSHVDLGPTLLDLLEIGHNPRDFQGVSVLRNYRRPHIFAYGNEGTITVYTNEFRKVQRLRDTSCRMFDLQTDAAEKQPLACDSGADSLESATKYAAGQMVLLQQLQNKNP